MTYRPQSMNTYTVSLSNGKTVRVSAPSPQRAVTRIEREIARKGLSLTIVSAV